MEPKGCFPAMSAARVAPCIAAAASFSKYSFTLVLQGYVCDLSEIAAVNFGKSNCNSFHIVSSELVRRINKALDPVPQTDDKRTNNQGRESLNTAQYFVVRQTSIQSNSLGYIQHSNTKKYIEPQLLLQTGN